jgi:hypothetical protein
MFVLYHTNDNSMTGSGNALLEARTQYQASDSAAGAVKATREAADTALRLMMRGLIAILAMLLAAAVLWPRSNTDPPASTRESRASASRSTVFLIPWSARST